MYLAKSDGGMPLAQLQLGLSPWEGEELFKLAASETLAPQFPLAEPATNHELYMTDTNR
jgi:hypothetical protein